MRTIALTEETRKNVLENLLKRSPSSYGKFEDAVAEIVENVRNNKDAAVFEYTKRFDGADINAGNIKVTKEEIDEAYEQVDPSLLDVIRKALVNIREYHEKQKKYSWFDSKPDGTMLGQKVTATCKSRCLCSGWKSSLSFFCSDECCTGKSGRCGEDHHDDPLRKGRKSVSVHTCCRYGGRSR